MAALAGLLAACAAGQTSRPGPDPVSIADRFQARLQSELRAAMAAGGAVEAVAACSAIAPAVAAELSAQSGATVRRVALRARNPAARVDGRMRAELERLAAAPLDGAGRPAVVMWREGRRSHWLRAIPMLAEPCATCHGPAIPAAVAARIEELYPADEATGFVPGEMRGAIAISWDRAVR